MSSSDKIQFSIAVVAGVAAILTAINIWVSNLNIQQQKKQWEFSLKPVFKISYIQEFAGDKTGFVIENSNHVYHEMKDINFSLDGVKVDMVFDGIIDTGKVGEERVVVAKGLIITLLPGDDSYYEGYLQIVGKDSLGREFKVKSNAIKFKEKEIINDLELSRTYLKNI